MNKFETSLLQTLSSIDESLKLLATGKPPAAAKPAVKKVKKAANGKLPKVVAKTAKALEKAAAKAAPAKPESRR